MIQLGAGQTTLDFNPGGATGLENQISSLFFRQNLNRYYEKQNYWGQYSMYLNQEIKVTASFSANKNLSLNNHSDFSFFFKGERYYDANLPDNDQYLMESHRNRTLALELEYTPGQNYYLYKDLKIFTPSKYPTFTFNWRRETMDYFDKTYDYHFVKTDIRQNISLGGSENLNYYVSAGVFLDKKPIFFSAFNHFATQPLMVGAKDFNNTFQLLDYYKYSTNDRFVEGTHCLLNAFSFVKTTPNHTRSCLDRKGDGQLSLYTSA